MQRRVVSSNRRAALQRNYLKELKGAHISGVARVHNVTDRIIENGKRVRMG